MPEQKYLTDEQLQEITYGRIGSSAPEQQEELADLPMRDYSDVPDFSEQLLFTWVSPERAFRPRLSKHYKRNLILILVLIVLLLAFVQQLALLIVTLSLIFMAYVLANVPPHKIRHTITNYGVYSHERFYPWLERGKRFWFEKSNGQEQVIFEMQRFPYRVVLLVGHPRNKKCIQEVFSHYLVCQKPAPTDIDKLIDWWQKHFSLE